MTTDRLFCGIIIQYKRGLKFFLGEEYMLYKKNYMSTLSDELFRSPTSEYRAAPFWAWNCKLEEKELLRQIDGYGISER